MTTVPPEALTTAAQLIADEMRKHPVFDVSLAPERLREIAFEFAAVALDRVAPMIAAAERKRILLLLEEEARRIQQQNFSAADTVCAAALRDFADSLRAEVTR